MVCWSRWCRVIRYRYCRLLKEVIMDFDCDVVVLCW